MLLRPDTPVFKDFGYKRNDNLADAADKDAKRKGIILLQRLIRGRAK